MDVVIYIRDMQRMCKPRISCNGGELKPGNGKSYMEEMDPQKCISVVEQWAAEHPIKTRQSVFLKMFPNAILNDKGQFSFCPKMLDTAYHPVGGCCLDVDICQRCMDNFWGQEVEE